MAFDNIKLEKGLYTTGKSFTQTLEEIDPSENYKGTSLEGLDAYERQLKRFDIKVSGCDSDSVSKFFSTTDSATLFPEYLSRAVNMGVTKDSKVDKIIATTTNIDALDYRSIKVKSKDNSYDLIEVAEGVELPELKITVADSLTKLKKHGRTLKASYEAIKFQRLDLFTITLKHLGETIAHSEFRQAMDEILNSTELMDVTDKSDNISYDGLVDLWTELQPFNLTTIIVNKNVFAEILKMPEFRDANAGLNFHGTGAVITPFGAELLTYDKIPDKCAIGLDRTSTLEKVQVGGILTEYDKLIDCQLERAAISTITGFAPIYTEAMAALVAKAN